MKLLILSFILSATLCCGMQPNEMSAHEKVSLICAVSHGSLVADNQVIKFPVYEKEGQYSCSFENTLDYLKAAATSVKGLPNPAEIRSTLDQFLMENFDFASKTLREEAWGGLETILAHGFSCDLFWQNSSSKFRTNEWQDFQEALKTKNQQLINNHMNRIREKKEFLKNRTIWDVDEQDS